MRSVRLYKRLVCLVCSLFLFAFFIHPATTHASIPINAEATPEEIINEVGRLTGLPKDTLDILMEESPALFAKVSDMVTAAKVIDLFYNARDTEALAEILNWKMSGYIDSTLKKLYPPAMMNFIAVVKVYKTSLELMRDWVFIPSLEATIYERYKRARGGVQDWRYANPEEAYMQATASGKYFPAKQKMFDELVKAKGYNKNQIGEQLEKHLWKKIDSFWKRKLEAQYQRELFKKSRDRLIEHLWAKRKAELEAIKKAAGNIKPSPKAYFLKQEDIPEPWALKFDRLYTREKFVPGHHENEVWWTQMFTLYPSYLTVKRTESGNENLYDANGKSISVMHNSMRIRMRPDLFVAESGYGFHHREWLEKDIEAGKMTHTTTEWQTDNVRMLDLGVEGVDVGYIFKKTRNDRDKYHCAFVKGAWYVAFEIEGSPNSHISKLRAKGRNVSESPISIDLVRYIARTIADRIPASKKSQKKAKR